MMNILLYRLGVSAYSAAIGIAANFNEKPRMFINGRKGLLERIQAEMKAEKRPRVWMHCASLGEFEQGRPVLEAMRLKYPDYCFVLTFFSPSGYEVRKNYEGADYVYYLPVDSPANAQAFVKAVQPALAIFVKYELWYYYLQQLQFNKTPVLLISALFSERHGFFKWYGGLQRNMLRMCTQILVQDEHSSQLLKSINITNVMVTGDTRFDRVATAVKNAETIPQIAEFCASENILVAGSTWPDDEAMLLQWLDKSPDWKLVLVPHNVDQHSLNRIKNLFAGKITCWSEGIPQNSARVLLIDTVGLLLKVYQYGTAAYIGGGFGKAGVHNVLEPAAWGQPCLYGPVYHQFIEATGLIEAGGAVVVKNANELNIQTEKLSDALNREKIADAARKFVRAHLGATDRVMDVIASYLQ